jgi:prevent-host-death family protein
MANFDIRVNYNDPNRIPVTEASQRFFELIKTIENTETRKLITRNGKVIAALVPLSEIAFIDELRAKQCVSQLHVNNL